MSLTSDQSSLITNQNKIIDEQIGALNNEILKYEKQADYQNQLQASVKFFNNVLILIYIFIFTLIHVLFAQQYLMGVKRNEWKDTIWLFIFFLYPYMIYMIERYVYFFISYILDTLYGKTYVYKFDQLFTSTDFYKRPPK